VTVRVFVNERPVDVPAGATVAAAVLAFDPVLGAAVESGAATITDARALAVDPAAPVEPGTILRVVGRRAGADAQP
jgi:hypothetical protein